MNFCSHCGSAQLIHTIPEGDNRLRYVCTQCETIHYQNPKMVVGCLVEWEGHILLCKRAIPPREGYWNLPAGYLENGETLQEGALRETREEAGLEVDLIRLHAVYNIPRISQIYFFFLAKANQEHIPGGPESLEARWFLPEQIPFEDMAFPSSTYAIQQHLQSPPEAIDVHLGGWQD